MSDGSPKLTVVPPPPPPPPPTDIKPDARREVFLDADESRVTTETVIAIAGRGDVYQRGGKIVEPRIIPAPQTMKRILRANDSWQIAEARPPRVRSLAAESCRFTKFNKKGKKIDANVPDYLPSAVLAASEWPFPTLSGIAEAPTLRPDGTLITKKGFDTATGIYLASEFSIHIPDLPTLDDARKAANLLLDVICDFPFLSDAGRSTWLSGVLSVAARPVIHGAVPMHLVDASMRGSGKSKLVDAASIITTGRPASRMIYADSDEEMDKRITSLALAGDSLVLIDNVAGEFGCPSLDAAITSTLYRGRLLGKSEMTPHMPMNIVWWATGNGMLVGADLARRSILARLEPQCAHPEEREGPKPGKTWRHPRLLTYVTEQRATLLGAALTLVRAYLISGSIQRLRPMDFDAWSDTIRAAIVWAGFSDPAETVKDVKAADTRADAFQMVVECWPAAERAEVTAADLIDFAKTRVEIACTADATAAAKVDETRSLLWRNALLEWCPPRRGEGPLPSPRSLGFALRSVKGAITGKYKIDAGEKTMRGIPWLKINVVD